MQSSVLKTSGPSSLWFRREQKTPDLPDPSIISCRTCLGSHNSWTFGSVYGLLTTKVGPTWKKRPSGMIFGSRNTKTWSMTNECARRESEQMTKIPAMHTPGKKSDIFSFHFSDSYFKDEKTILIFSYFSVQSQISQLLTSSFSPNNLTHLRHYTKVPSSTWRQCSFVRRIWKCWKSWERRRQMRLAAEEAQWASERCQ